MSRVTVILVAIILMAAGCAISWRSGWNSHAVHINALAAKKKEQAEKTIAPVERKAAEQKSEAKVIYKNITRDVVKYVQSPNRTVCKFDDDAIRLRQQAVDAANNIPGFDDAAVQDK